MNNAMGDMIANDNVYRWRSKARILVVFAAVGALSAILMEGPDFLFRDIVAWYIGVKFGGWLHDRLLAP